MGLTQGQTGGGHGFRNQFDAAEGWGWGWSELLGFNGFVEEWLFSVNWLEVL